jgi:Fe-S-cluster containining protein
MVADELRARASAELAKTGKPLVRLRVIAAESAAVAQRLTDEARAALPPTQPIECGAGCAWCCHLPVGVTLAELAALVDEIQRWPDREKLLQQLKKIAASRGERQPCPLLDGDKRCRAYQARPFACRGLNSYSARRCESHFFAGRGTLRAWSPQFDLHREARDGVRAALGDFLGEEMPLLELVTALSIALSLPPERWLSAAPWKKAAFDQALPGFREKR